MSTSETTQTTAEWYLDATGGAQTVQNYHRDLVLEQRIGQAFFNNLTSEDQERLRGTLLDPFYKDGAEAVKHLETVIDFLCRKR